MRAMASCWLLLALAAGRAASAVPATGDPALPPERCRVLRLHGSSGEAAACFEALTHSGSAYQRAEGYWGLGRYDEANEQFRIATSAPEARALYKVRWGMLLHARFNNKDAADLFGEALKQEPGNASAYLGLAMLSADGFDDKAADYIAKALAADPKLVAAHTFAANLALEDAKPDAAIQEADVAIALSPYGAGSDVLDAMAVRASAALLADHEAEAADWLAKIAAVNPGYGEAYAIVARQLVLNRRYTEGVAYYRRSIAAEPTLWTAHSELGINLMRLGQEDEPRQQLELAYTHGQRDAATVNSLRLLDSYQNFVTYKDETTILRLRKSEADLLQPYFSAELHKAIATYSAKYKMKLDGPVQVEVYPDHEDFAVRTMGMPGLGALGVTFGEVVAMDSPSGRLPGDFNWGATLWHEMSHVFILTATNHRVPRWFTEGLAVHEEGQVHAEWANRLTPDVVAAMRDKKLLPIAEMDRGFLFPQYPDQVIVSYWQAGTICDYIQERWGADALLGMVHSFAALKTTPEAIEANLHEAPEGFDKDYAAWLQKRYGATVANFDAWHQRVDALVKLTRSQPAAAVGASSTASRSGKLGDAVIAEAPAMISMYPQYVGDANGYEPLAAADLANGDKKAAVGVLSAYAKMGGENPVALKKLASLEREMGDTTAAAATLDSLNFIYPEDQGLHRELGGLWLAQGNTAGAVREYTAVLALKPLDVAAAQLDLADAYMAAGDHAKAEESVLAALEAAPGFRPAQKLLLQIESAQPSTPAPPTPSTN